MSAFEPTPAPTLRGLQAYGVPRSQTPVDLVLDGNEGLLPPASLLEGLADIDPELLRRYPSAAPLERELARAAGVEAERVLVTAGADEALDRMCRAYLFAGREIVLPRPTFSMIAHYAGLAGGRVVEVPWPTGPYPLDEVLAAVTEATAIVACVTPNNPTGAHATGEEVERLARALPGTLVLLDLAYAEFAEEDLMPRAVALDNVLVLRTFSKALGLAGLRVGYAVGSRAVIEPLRAAGGPYSVSALSLLLAERALGVEGPACRAFVARVQGERTELARLLADLGAEPRPSQGNFVCCDFRDPAWVQEASAGLGVGLRRFDSDPDLARCLRITCPGNARDFERLCHALRTALAPQALLFDLDGVLADVTGSYRRAMVETAASFGVTLDPEEITAAKLAGDANNDWELTQRLLAHRGVEVDLAEVTRRFEELYQGTGEQPGLHTTETLLTDRALLESLARRVPLGIVTGRPRRDLDRFMEAADIESVMSVSVALEDATPKPDPAPVLCALERLGVQSAWMVGDTPDDVRAARAAGVCPLGLLSPSERATDGAVQERVTRGLLAAGAARVLDRLEDLEEMLP